MEKIKGKLLLAYRAENLGAGLYSKLASIYRNQPNLARKFAEFSAHEAKHAKMFNHFHKKEFGVELTGGSKWFMAGKFVATMQMLLPLKVKLRLIGNIEQKAMKQLEDALAKGGQNPYLEMVAKILPDEREHAEFYSRWYSI